jgi:hypothetical protein
MVEAVPPFGADDEVVKDRKAKAFATRAEIADPRPAGQGGAHIGSLEREVAGGDAMRPADSCMP